MRDKITGKPRGFGFVVFADPHVLDKVLQDTHVIDGRTVETKRALSREEQQGPNSGNVGSARSSGGSGNNRTKKIFVGGLPPTLTEDGFRTYFESYDAGDKVLHKTYHDLSGEQVEVKRSLPRDGNSGFSGRSSGNNPSSYDRMDTNRYMQNTGYGTPGYGYGSSDNGMGYGGYGSYGGANPGYGGVDPGYGGCAVAAGYGSGQAGGPRTSWGSQGPSGCGNMGYGNVSWGASSARGGGGPVNAGSAADQSLTGATGYGPHGGQVGYGGGYGGAPSRQAQQH